jgi:NAD dependent epimerase/dehydratase
MNLRNEKIFVTGADGFIGSHLVEALVRHGCIVRALALYNSFNSRGWLDRVAEDVEGNFEVVTGDVRDPFGLHDAMQGCSVVFHLAALIAIPFSYRHPESYLDTNVRGTLNLLQAARSLGVMKVVCTSTSEVYGTARFVPMTEDHPLNAQSPYAATKIAADQLALSYFHSFALPITILRPFNTYGPRQSARAVIPTIIGQIAAGARELRLGAVHPTRDFTFVRDTAIGFIQAAESDDTVGRVTNIGSGFEISIGDTAAMIAEIMGVEVEIVEDDQRLRPASSEVERLFAGVDHARRLFHWNPAHAGRDGFARGLRETAAWFADPGNLAMYRPWDYNI